MILRLSSHRPAKVCPGRHARTRRWPAVCAITVALLTVVEPAAAQQAPGWFAIPPSATFETGDSWTDRGLTYRLYGVQACLRGTRLTNAHGMQRDCGEASLTMLVALVRDLRPRCYPAADRPPSSMVLVFCIALPAAGAGAGSRIDLGTALIVSGFAFAALTPEGRPIHPSYGAAEAVAQRSRAGLWAFADLPEPNTIILRALKDARPAAVPAPAAAAPIHHIPEP